MLSFSDMTNLKCKSYRTVNASISGDTSAGGLRRLPDLLETHQPRIVIIELGGNDGLRGYPVGQLRNNLNKMIGLAEDANARVLMLPMEIPPNFGKFYTDAFRASFSGAIDGTDAILADFPLESVALDRSLQHSRSAAVRDERHRVRRAVGRRVARSGRRIILLA